MFDPERPELPAVIREQVEIRVKYAGYIERQMRDVEPVSYTHLMTLDQLSNLVKDPKLFGILIVRPFGLLLQWLYSICLLYTSRCV